MSMLDDANLQFARDLPMHVYRGYTCRFTGLKTAREDSRVVGQIIASNGTPRRLVVCVPTGYIGSYGNGDTFELGSAYDLGEFIGPPEAIAETCARISFDLQARLKILYRLIDQTLDGQG